MIEMESKDREMIKMNNMLDQFKVLQIQFQVQSQEQLTLINRFQEVSASSQELESELREKNRKIYQLEQLKLRLEDENRMHRSGGSKQQSMG